MWLARFCGMMTRVIMQGKNPLVPKRALERPVHVVIFLAGVDVGKEALGGVENKCKKNGWQIAERSRGWRCVPQPMKRCGKKR